MKTIRLGCLLCVLFLLPISLKASESSGTIDFSNKNALVCHSVDCTTPTPGVINFSPTGAVPVTIDDANGIDGIAWGNEIGWINFDPTGSAGVTINPNTGVISGEAWSQAAGWINFSVTGQSVKINDSGEFVGYAWTGGPYGGWIRFDCGFAGACVKTDWRPAPVRAVVTPPTTTPGPGSTSGAGGQGSTSDMPDACPNLVGYQSVVPDNYALDAGGLCLIKIDYCKNLDGQQLTIPSQYILNGEGQCVMLTDENKSELMPDLNSNATNTIGHSQTPITQDFCPNLFGVQSRIPPGFVSNESACAPENLDYCPNIPDNQYTVPADMKITDKGECVKMSKSEIKKYKNQQTTYDTEVKVLGYVFIPDSIKIPVVFPFTNKAFMIGSNQVDVWSFIISILLILTTIFAIKRKLEADLAAKNR